MMSLTALTGNGAKHGNFGRFIPGWHADDDAGSGGIKAPHKRGNGTASLPSRWCSKMQSTNIEQADRAIADAATPARDTTPVKVAGWLSEVADQPQLITLCTAVLLSGAVSGDKRLAAAGGKMLAAELLATAMKDAIKHRVDRTRPEAVEDGKPYVMKPGNSRESDRNSFPSGHTAGAVAVASVIADAYPRACIPAYAAAAAIAVIQIPRSKHYVSDLVVGSVIGAAAGYVANAIGGLRSARAD